MSNVLLLCVGGQQASGTAVQALPQWGTDWRPGGGGEGEAEGAGPTGGWTW